MLTVAQYNALSTNRDVYSLNSMFSQQKWQYFYKEGGFVAHITALRDKLNMSEKNEAMAPFLDGPYGGEPAEANMFGDVWRATHRYLTVLSNYFALKIKVFIDGEVAYKNPLDGTGVSLTDVNLKRVDGNLVSMGDELIAAPNAAMDVIFAKQGMVDTVFPLEVPVIPKFPLS